MKTPSLQIETNLNPDFLCYDWKISRTSRILTQPPTENRMHQIHELLSVSRQTLNADKTTQNHLLGHIADDTPTTLYISEIKVYLKKSGDKYAAVFTGIYTLEEIQKGRIHQDKNTAPNFKTTSGTGSRTENYTVNCQISREKRAFFCTSKLTKEDYCRGKTSPDDPFAKGKIRKEIEERLRTPYPHQRRTSLCGPAAFYYCLLKDRPDIYKAAAWQLWKYGETRIHKLTIKPGNDCRNPKNIDGVSALDWLTLASLRDSANIVRDYDEVNDQVPGITMPGGLVKWFARIGSSLIEKTTDMFSSRDLSNLVKLNRHYANNLHVVLFVAAKILSGSNTANTKDHWIVLAGNITVNGQPVSMNSPLDGIIEGKVFTWGNIINIPQGITLGKFLNHFYGGLVFELIK